jgi:Concanavalin A-like lectin/glucanases superfamily
MTHHLGRAMRAALIAGTLLLVAPGAASASGSFPLAGYWPLNEGSGQLARDWSGRGNHGQLGSTAQVDDNDPSWIRGVFGFGHGLNFGGDDFVAIPDTPELEPSRITVETWFRREGTPGRFSYLVAKGGDGCEAGSYGLYTSGNSGLAFYVYDGTAWTRSPEADPEVWDGRWHHAAGTYDGSVVRLFVDGRQVGTGTPAGAEIEYDLPEGDATIGAYRASCDLLFSGDLDEVRIWSRALPVSDIWDRVRTLLALLRR